MLVDTVFLDLALPASDHHSMQLEHLTFHVSLNGFSLAFTVDAHSSHHLQTIELLTYLARFNKRDAFDTSSAISRVIWDRLVTCGPYQINPQHV